jgi:SAM-dependent methyltransferase
MDPRLHWEHVYETKAPDAVSWYAPHLAVSLHYVAAAAPNRHAAIIDVGGGASTLVDDLLATGYRNITVLDISSKAIAVARQRLGPAGGYPTWLCADVLEADLPDGMFDVWHDRAVFHFLLTDEQRRHYVAQVRKALKPDGHVIVGTFGPDGPLKCSGLDVSRYSPGELLHVFGEEFKRLDSRIELHTTPWGSTQQFVHCHFQRVAG